MKLDDYNDLRFVLAAARAGTLTGAAGQLKVDQTTVTRRLRALEKRLGVKVFDRLRGGITLTPAGDSCVRAAEAFEQQIHDLERELSGEDPNLAGPLRLTLPELFASAWVDELAAFAEAHPTVRLEIVADNTIRSLSRGEADVAVRVIHTPAEHLVGRRLSGMALCIYAATALAETPVETIPWVEWDPAESEGSVIGRTREKLGATGPTRLYVNSYLVLLEAVRRGVGGCVLPCVLGDREPALARVTEPWRVEQSLWLLTHPDLKKSPRIRVLVDRLTDHLLAERPILEGGRPRSGQR